MSKNTSTSVFIPSPTSGQASGQGDSGIKDLLDTNALRIYRIGIGEVAFIPLQPVISETVKMQNEVDTSLYGKTNPLVSYTNTTRSYKFDSVINYDIAQFLFKADKDTGLNSTNGTELMDLYTLIRSFLYANYEAIPFDKNDPSLATAAITIKSPPLFKVKFKNLISYSDNGLCPDGHAKEVGLLGTFSEFKIEPVFVGNYIPWASNMSIDRTGGATGTIMNNAGYQKLQLSFTFVPISQEPMGWQQAAGGNNSLRFGGINELRQAVIAENAIKKILGN